MSPDSNDALIHDWDEWMKARNLTDRTRYQYRYAVNRFLAYLTPPRHVSRVTETDLVVFLTSHGTRGPVKTQYMKGLRSFFGWAAEREEVSGVSPATDPTRNIRPKVPPPPEPDAYSLGEVVALVRAAATRSQRRADALQVIYGMGLRRIEMCRLRQDDLEWERDRVLVTGKGAWRRYLSLSDVTRDPLRRLADYHRDPVLDLTPERLTAWAHDAACDAGVKRPGRSVHILRRSFASHLRAEGIDILIVSKLLGHANLATTQRYFASSQDEKTQAMQRVPALTGGTV